MKKIISGLIVLMTAFVSCIDQEKIDIAYQTDVSISAIHIFDTYTAVAGNEFDMQTAEATWTLNLHAFIYDNEGQLVKKVEDEFPNLTSTLAFDLDLLPGKYSLVAIADFSALYSGQDYQLWNISNEDNLRDLTINEADEFLSSPFETLGITSKEFEIGEKVENIVIDIKPVTGLLQTVMWEEDMSGNGTDNYSFYSPYITDVSIWAPEMKQTVKFNGSITPSYNFDIQGETHRIAMSNPQLNFENKRSQHLVSYRAILPQEGLDFYWTLNCVPGCGQYLFKDKKDFQMSEMTENKLNIESGKQYAMDLLLDGLYLYVQDYDKNVDMYDRAKEIQWFCNMKLAKDFFEGGFDKYLGKNLSTIETYLNRNSDIIDNDKAYFFLNEGFCEGLVVLFTDNTKENAKRVMMLLNVPSREGFDLVADALSEKYVPYEKGSTANIKQFINSESTSEATVLISWDAYNNCLYFDAIK